MKNLLILCLLAFLQAGISPLNAQPCTPMGDQNSYGTGDVWIGYVYDGTAFNTYIGYINEGTAGNPNFNESFGGNNVTLATNGCSTQTETFSVRFKLSKTFAAGTYDITVGGDDGYRLSLDGGSTWVIDRWWDQGYNTSTYTATLSGATNLVIEYYENGGGNQVSFNVVAGCTGSGNPAVYGTGDVWQGYIYDGTAFNTYRGYVTEGVAGNCRFDENFGGSNVNYNTSDCPVQTETFSARYRLTKYFPPDEYIFTVGGDDGYRLSLDGGSTWIIDRWYDQSYNIQSTNVMLNGTYNMVLEFYENGGDNRISFDYTSMLLPVVLHYFTGNRQDNTVQLSWETGREMAFDHFAVERSGDGRQFDPVGRVSGNNGRLNQYRFSDPDPGPGINYYRLQLVDQNGHRSYSAVLRVSSASQSTTRLFPTLIDTRRQFYLQSGETLARQELKIYDIWGRERYARSFPEIQANATLLIDLSGSSLPSGWYVAQWRESSGKKLLTQKIRLE